MVPWLIALVACAPRVEAPPEVTVDAPADGACAADAPRADDPVALTRLLADPAVAEIHVAPGAYPAVEVTRPVRLYGLGRGGGCAPPAGADGPTLGALTVRGAGADVAGFRVGGPVVAEGASTVRRLTVWGARTGIDARAGARVEAVLVSACDTGVRLSGDATLTQSVVARNRGDGVLAEGPAHLDQVTLAANGDAGARLRGGGQTLVNLVVTGNRGWGLYEEDPWRFGDTVLFHDNGAGHYGGDDPLLAYPPAWYADDVAAAPQLLRGDRYETGALMHEGGLRAVSRALEPPWSGFPPDLPATQALDVRTVEAALRPTGPIRASWRRAAPPEGRTLTDVAGRPRAPDERLGALESAPAWSTAAPLVVAPEGRDDAAGTVDAPLATIAEALRRAEHGQTVLVVTGRYAETVSITHREVSLQGVKRSADDPRVLVPIDDADDPAIPVLDVGRGGAPQHGLLLLGVGQASAVRGLAIEGAVNGVFVTAGDEDPRLAPRLEALRFVRNRVGVLVGSGQGAITRSVFVDNTAGLWVQGLASWRVEASRFEDNGTALVLPTTVVGGFDDVVLADSTLIRSPVSIDALVGRDGRGVTLTRNRFVDASVLVGHAEPGGTVRVLANTFEGGSGVRLQGAAWASPTVELADNVWPAGGLVAEGPGWTSLPTTQPAVVAPAPGGPPTTPAFDAAARRVTPHSAPIVAHPDGTRLYAVAADFDGVGEFARDRRLERTRFFATGPDPRGVALSADGGTLLVADFGADTVSFVDLASGAVTPVVVGSEPFGIVVDGDDAWVSVSGDAAVVRLDVPTRRVAARVAVPETPRGLALTDADGRRRLVVTHFLPGRRPGAVPGTSAELVPRVSFVDLDGANAVRTLELPPVPSADFPPVVPVQLAAVVVRGDRAYLPSPGVHPELPERYRLRDRAIPKFLAGTHGVLSVIDLVTEAPLPAESGNLGVRGQVVSNPSHVAFDPDDDVAYVASGGGDHVTRVRVRPGLPPTPLRPWRVALDLQVGTDPRGVLLDPARGVLLTPNFGNGTLSSSRLDTGLFADVARLGPDERDRLSDEARHGRQLFSSTLTAEGTSGFAMSCASCHPDGRADGVTWAFTYGPRSTPHLAGSPDTLPLHFDGDRDEVADFEHTLRDLQGGLGFVQGAIPSEIGGAYPEPDAENWRHFEAYLREGVRPVRPPTPTGREDAGRAVFERLGCGACHGTRWFASARVAGVQPGDRVVTAALRDVGTRGPGGPAGTPGLDPPSLWGLAQSAPYLHDGRAGTLAEVLANPRHAGAPLSDADREDLVAFLRSITDGTPPAP